MSLGDLVLVLLVLLAAVVTAGAVVLHVVGFSLGKGALITVAFLFVGFWNPVGWIVLGLCAWVQVKENRGRLLARQAPPQVTPVAPTRVKVGPVTATAHPRRRMLRSGDECLWR